MKPLVWLGSSHRDYTRFPNQVQHDMGYALFVAQAGGRHRTAKPLKGFGGAGVLELVDDHEGDTYRAVYTVRYGERVYVLHAFQKKAKRRIETPQSEIRVIKKRLRAADADHRARQVEEKGKQP